MLRWLGGDRVVGFYIKKGVWTASLEARVRAAGVQPMKRRSSDWLGDGWAPGSVGGRH